MDVILTRYSTPEMRRIFSDEAKLRRWLKVEAALAKACAEVGIVPYNVAKEIEYKASIDYVKPDRVKELENKIQHDVLAMVEALIEVCEGEAKRYVHYGITSYDVVDTANALAFKEAIRILEADLKKLKSILIDLAKKTRDLVCIGRTHGQHAIPTTYGMKFAVWAYEIHRHLERLNEIKKRILVGKISGAVGTMAGLGSKGLEIQRKVMKILGLNVPLITNQVIQRDRHAELMMLLALISATLDKIAKEIRNLQRTEISEVFEPFGRFQAGSSTMPHKRNPHKCERISSLFRYVKSLVMVTLDNISLEHERDLTNSANERIILPNAFMIVDYMLRLMCRILKGLEFNVKNIEHNLELTGGAIMAERIMLELVNRGMNRSEAYSIIREIAMKAYNVGKEFRELIMNDVRVLSLISKEELEKLLNPKTYIGLAREIVDLTISSITP